MGYFVAADAPTYIQEERRAYFRQHALPELFRQMCLLGISIDEVVKLYKEQQKS